MGVCPSRRMPHTLGMTAERRLAQAAQHSLANTH